MIQTFKSRLPVLAIHGGAGDLRPEDLSPEQSARYRDAMERVMAAAWPILRDGSSALEVAVEAARLLEDEPLFNAGRGSVFTSEQTHEMDAAVMCGATGQAGAVAGVTGIRNPIVTARHVLEEKNYVLLSGRGAEEYAHSKDDAFEYAEYFYTEERHQQLLKAKVEDRVALDHHKYGTIGAVVVDLEGNCAAATSTGGLTNKKYGRIGDSPIIGAGTYASNKTCAISCTGYGEPFLLRTAAYQVAARIEFGGASLEEAVRATVEEDLPGFDGDGGLIAVGPSGEIVLGYNSAMMYRGWVGADVEAGVGIA
jgi:beta-aspartyl-peptidase (threonine type)